MRLGLYFLLTLLLELPVILYWLRDEWRKALTIGFLLNLFTWPLLAVLAEMNTIPLLLLETGVVLTEGIGYRIFFQRSWISCLGFSLLANGISYGVGILLANS